MTLDISTAETAEATEDELNQKLIMDIQKLTSNSEEHTTRKYCEYCDEYTAFFYANHTGRYHCKDCGTQV